MAREGYIKPIISTMCRYALNTISETWGLLKVYDFYYV